MKVFIVITERDGDTIKSSGQTTTEITRIDRRFAANHISEVWEATEYLRAFEDERFIGIFEEHPAITVLGGKDE